MTVIADEISVTSTPEQSQARVVAFVNASRQQEFDSSIENTHVWDIVHAYTKIPVPHVFVQCAYLALSKLQIAEPSQTPLSSEQLLELVDNGIEINNFITNHLLEDHPTDKRFLLRYVEQLCTRFNLKSHKCPGFGHDIVYSIEPIDQHYPVKFDNTLYFPPLSGHWSIVGRAAARD